jgi:hypothetical protein
VYYFCHRPAFAWFPQWVRADHGTEVFFVMDFGDFQPSAEDVELSQLIRSYWVNFARTGQVYELCRRQDVCFFMNLRDKIPNSELTNKSRFKTMKNLVTDITL